MVDGSVGSSPSVPTFIPCLVSISPQIGCRSSLFPILPDVLSISQIQPARSFSLPGRPAPWGVDQSPGGHHEVSFAVWECPCALRDRLGDCTDRCGGKGLAAEHGRAAAHGTSCVGHQAVGYAASHAGYSRPKNRLEADRHRRDSLGLSRRRGSHQWPRAGRGPKTRHRPGTLLPRPGTTGLPCPARAGSQKRLGTRRTHRKQPGRHRSGGGLEDGPGTLPS